MKLERYRIVQVLLFCVAGLVISCGRTAPTPVNTASASTLGSAGPTFVVQRGKVVKTLEFSGRVVPVDQTPLYFKTPGYVKQVYVRQGDRVKAGDLLAELETDDLLNEIAQAEVALDSAQLLLSEAEKSLAHQIALARLDLAAAQATFEQAQGSNVHAIAQTELALALAREQFTRTRTLQTSYVAGVVSARVGLEQAQEAVGYAEIEYQKALDRPWESQEVHDGYAYSLRLARWNLEIAQAQYDQAVANQGAHLHDPKIQEIAIRQAETELEQLKQGVDPLLSIQVQQAQLALDRLEEGVDSALINDVNQAQLALERLQGHLANAQIVASVEGEVLSLSIQAARPVEAFKTVLIIADPALLEVSAELFNDQLDVITEGQRASVTLNADPTHVWSGTVLRVPYPYGSGNGVEGDANSDHSIRIGLEGDVGGLRLGDPLQVSIALNEKDDALWLPPAAVRSYQGREFVIVQDGERQRRIDVELGIEGYDQVEVLRGLKEGQLVVAP
jgi:multidrug efflux pump subunit AcrA (membrane-fusion protein)